MLKIISTLDDETLVDPNAALALLLSECRIIYKNKQLTELIAEKNEDTFKKSH